MKLSKILLSIAMSLALLNAQGSKKDATPPAATKTEKAKTEKKKTVPAADQCQAMTKDGDQCKRKASAGSKFCWQHGGKKSTDKAAPKKS